MDVATMPIKQEDIDHLNSIIGTKDIKGFPFGRHRFNLYFNMLRKGPCSVLWEAYTKELMEGTYKVSTFYEATQCMAGLMTMEHSTTRFIIPYQHEELQIEKVLPLVQSIKESIENETPIGLYSILPFMIQQCLYKDHKLRDRKIPYQTLQEFANAVEDPNEKTVIDYYEKAVAACYYRQQNTMDAHDCCILQTQRHIAYQLASKELVQCVNANSDEFRADDALFSCFEIANSFTPESIDLLRPEFAAMVLHNQEIDTIL